MLVFPAATIFQMVYLLILLPIQTAYESPMVVPPEVYTHPAIVPNSFLAINLLYNFHCLSATYQSSPSHSSYRYLIATNRATVFLSNFFYCHIIHYHMISPNFDFEKSLLPPSCRFLLGIDEVGRGPLAGPVTIGAFLLDLGTFNPQEFINLSVRDSKLLSSRQRQKIFYYLQSFRPQTFSAASVDIDQQGIGRTINLLVIQALRAFQGQFDFYLLDGFLPCQGEVSVGRRGLSIVKGDQKCFSIAAASIVAKVTRDCIMDGFDSQYPQYGFKHHKGYGTKQHLSALKLHGPCPIHRLSFRPLSTDFPHHNSRRY